MTSIPRPPRARRLARAAAFALAAHGIGAAGCDPPKQRRPIEMAPIGTVPILTRTTEEPDAGATTTPNSGTPSAAKESACTGDDFESLEEALKLCESKMPRSGDVPSSMRERLEVRVTSSTPTIAPGGRADISLTLKNKSNEPLPLYFTGDPSPRFEVEALDAKGKRIDLPPGKPPKAPAVPARDVKAARLTLTPGGSARVKIPWDAVKTRWAPEKVKTWEGRGYPRAAAGPLGAGKYVLRVVIPLVGVFEKGELDVPKIPIEVAP
jgi:hypothetical protein